MSASLDNISDIDLNTDCAVVRHVDGHERVVLYSDTNGSAFQDLFQHLNDEHGAALSSSKSDPNFSLEWDEHRWRGCLYNHTHGTTISLRCLPSRILSLSDLGFDQDGEQDLLSLCQDTGLTLVSGSTGSGKSTTMAACVALLRDQALLGKTITIEDPVEYEYDDPRIHQREVHVHVRSFADGVFDAMRQAPTTIVIGEIRRPEDAEAAVDAGLTGHRVLATVHASCVAEVIDRMWGLLDDRHDDLLPMALRGVVSQDLIRIPDGPVMPIWESLEVDLQCRSVMAQGSSALPQLISQQYRQGRMTFLERARYYRESGIIPHEYLRKWL